MEAHVSSNGLTPYRHHPRANNRSSASHSGYTTNGSTIVVNSPRWFTSFGMGTLTTFGFWVMVPFTNHPKHDVVQEYPFFLQPTIHDHGDTMPLREQAIEELKLQASPLWKCAAALMPASPHNLPCYVWFVLFLLAKYENQKVDPSPIFLNRETLFKTNLSITHHQNSGGDSRELSH